MADQALQAEQESWYPSTEGEKVGHSHLHALVIAYLFSQIQQHLLSRDVFVSYDLFVYWLKGNRDRKVAPDVIVKLDHPSPEPPRVWQTWVRGVPEVIFEIVSDGTFETDITTKVMDYEAMGVQEYYVVDPSRELISTGLRAWRQVGSIWQEVPIIGGIYSPMLGAELRVERYRGSWIIRLYDQGQALPLPEELIARLQALVAALQQERAEKELLQAQRKRLRAEKKRLLTEKEHERNEKERALRQLQEERQRAEEERHRADQANEQLRALLRKYGVEPGV